MRNAQRSISLTLMILSLVAGCLAQEAQTDYDRNADFSRYKTFSFEKIETKDPLWVDRIAAAVGGALTSRGLTQVASGGDIAIRTWSPVFGRFRHILSTDTQSIALN